MKLDEIPKKNIYEVPADYFEKLPGVMMNKVQGQRQETQGVFATLWALTWLKSSLAGLALIIFFTFIFLFKNNEPVYVTGQSTQLIASVSNNEAMEYLLTSDQLENYDLAMLPQAELDFTHEFLEAPAQEIEMAVELADLNDITE